MYSYTDLLLLLLIILALGMVFLSASQRSTALPISMNVLVAGFGGIMTLIVFYRVVINQPGPNDVVSVKFWAYIGILLTAGIAGGAFLAMREEGAKASARPPQGRRARPAPAPRRPPRRRLSRSRRPRRPPVLPRRRRSLRRRPSRRRPSRRPAQVPRRAPERATPRARRPRRARGTPTRAGTATARTAAAS